jgi:hypothetical protein
MSTFSQRYGHGPAIVAPSDLIHDDAPEGVRVGF